MTALLPPRLALQSLAHEHLEQGLVADPFMAGDLASFGEILRGQSQRDLHAGGAVQTGHERRAFPFPRSSRAGLPLEKLPALRTSPPFRFLVLVDELGIFKAVGVRFFGFLIASLSSRATLQVVARRDYCQQTAAFRFSVVHVTGLVIGGLFLD